MVEKGLRQELRLARVRRWQERNAEALRLREEDLHRNGHPLQALMSDEVHSLWERWQREPLD